MLIRFTYIYVLNLTLIYQKLFTEIDFGKLYTEVNEEGLPSM